MHVFRNFAFVLFVLTLVADPALASHHRAQDAATNGAEDSTALPPTIGMVTGPKTGTYIAFGRDIAAMAKKDGLAIHVYDSKGSTDNIERITSKEKVGLAIVQSDVLGYLGRSHNATTMAIARKLRLVAPLYNEEVHVLARRDINGVTDLTGKRVAIGGEGSGSYITAMNIFSTLGITPAKMYQTDAPHGALDVLNNQADAMVFVGGKPVKMFKNMEELGAIKQGPNAGILAEVHFLPLDDARLLKEYKAATLTHTDYDFVTDDVPTVAVTASLITYDYTLKDESYYRDQCGNMFKLAKALQSHIGEYRASGHPKWKEVNLTAPVAFWKHDGCSARAFNETGTTVAAEPVAPEPSGNPLERDLVGVIRQSRQ